jgi:hypothetical protein
VNRDDVEFFDSGTSEPAGQLDSGSQGISARTRVTLGLAVAVVVALIGWRIAAQHPGHTPASASSAKPGPTSPVPPSTGASPGACPSGDRCRVIAGLPAAVIQAVHVHLPAVQPAPAGQSTVLDLTTKTLAYRHITITGNGFELVVWVSPVDDAQPSDTDVLVPAGYHVKSLCSGPPRSCPTPTTLRALALDPRLVSIS